jgi:hypothetical protein
MTAAMSSIEPGTSTARGARCAGHDPAEVGREWLERGGPQLAVERRHAGDAAVGGGRGDPRAGPEIEAEHERAGGEAREKLAPRVAHTCLLACSAGTRPMPQRRSLTHGA